MTRSESSLADLVTAAAVDRPGQATHVMIYAAGHSGMLVPPRVIARMVAETTRREDVEDLGA
jgi:hypothetical protein